MRSASMTLRSMYILLELDRACDSGEWTDTKGEKFSRPKKHGGQLKNDAKEV